ncbi:MAG: hypothetical protein ACK53L_22980, partial [Pirellulaceae bacterium]
SHRAFSEVIGRYLFTGELLSGSLKSTATDDDSPTRAILAAKHLDHARTYYGAESSEYWDPQRTIGVMLELYADIQATALGPLEFRGGRDSWMTKDVCRGHRHTRFLVSQPSLSDERPSRR